MRKAIGLNQCKLAKISGCSQANISKIENGAIGVTAEIAVKISRAIKMSPKSFFKIFDCGEES